MRTSYCSGLLLFLGFQVFSQPVDFSALDAAAGKALFDKNWVQAPASTSSSDGLGPHYSTRSCAACHPGGGRGSAPLSNTLQINDPVYGRRLHQRALTLVPGEAKISWIPADSAEAESEIVNWKPLIAEPAYGPLQSAVSVRLATSLAGLARLEQVPVAVLQALADPDDADGNGISGRVAWLEQDEQGIRPGRFGWKAGTASLQIQTALALSLDIGISSPLYPEPWGDCTALQTACRNLAVATTVKGQEVEASQVIVDLLGTYLASLPVPDQLAYQETAHNLFQRIGCADCHVPDLPSPLGPVRAFTDLLLHDMGPELDDLLAEGAADSAEWRTAPLWSLPKQGPYMHDGRAATLQEAVQWHGGEADSSRQAFRQLNRDDQATLIVYLLGL